MTEKKTGSPLIGAAESVWAFEALHRGLSRRDALRLLGAAGLMATGVGSLLGRDGQAFAAEDAVSATPRRGGKVRAAAAGSSTADTLDPARGAFSGDYTRQYFFYNGLTVFDSHLEPQMALATAFDTQDALTWTIKLRQGVQFHNGKTFDSADVVYSLLRHKDPAVGSKAKALADQFAEVTAVAPDEVRIRLVSPNSELPAVLAISPFLIIANGTTDFSTANGTGPFKVKEFKPGVRTVGVRNENYWKSGKPYLDEVELIGITDEPSRVNALLANDVQLIVSVDPRSAERLKQGGKLKVVANNSGSYTNLIMRIPNRPFNDPNVVEGMKLLFDREQILKSVFLGYGIIGNDQPIMPGTPYYSADVPQRPYDPDKAKFLFQKAGIAGARMPLVTSTAADNANEMALVLQQSARQAGLNLMVNRVSADGYWDNHWMKDPLGFGNINARPTANILLSQFFKSDAPWNESGWKNEQFDQLLVASRGETDFAKRKQMYADMQLLVNQHCGIGLPIFTSSIDAHSPKLGGYGIIPIGGLMGYMFAEHVWLES
ncbi:ABC transporter substrate-binding protein [Pseudomonas oryzihabitans]|uniref:ABC transporter substrate-binding protein n=1 Tax=Pseudomonas oryzihabitans TaxID=47885 RepID=UPI00289602DF|nr:ABC transporter substrate-binding protein [Pseudomonas oryzihabitans]MDT3721665.1 ABC transporter substrate-binding protein [Pseudomonas oryzihabitans]